MCSQCFQNSNGNGRPNGKARPKTYDQYILVAHNSDKKLVTWLPDSSKGQDEDFLVITGNWQNPHIS